MSKYNRPQRRRQYLSSDTGTRQWQRLALATFAIYLTTGLLVSGSTPSRQVIPIEQALSAPLDLWSLHLASSLMLLCLALIIPAILRSGRTERLASLVRTGAGRLPQGKRLQARQPFGVALYWIVLALLVLETASGILLHLGYDGRLVALHQWSLILVLAYPIAHILVEFGYVHFQQVLNILTPGSLADTVRPPTLANIVRWHLGLGGPRLSRPK